MAPSDAPRNQPPHFARPRTPVLLLWLLLINTIAVAGLSVIALRGHLLEIEVNRRTASQRALSALAARVENALYQSVQEPSLLLRNIPQVALTDSRLERLRELDPHLRVLLVMNADFTPSTSSPALTTNELQFLSAAVKERVIDEKLQGMRAHTALRSFSGSDSSPRMLYIFLPLGNAVDYLGAAAAHNTGSWPWLLLGFDLDRLVQSELRPLLVEFERQHGERVALLPPDADEQDSAVSVNLSHILPGWRLEIISGAATPNGVIALLGPATIAASIGLVIAIGLISIAIARTLRREHTLLELRNRFVANVSHELKTPLSLIRMYAETLYLRRLRDPEREHEYHRVILAEAEKLSRMIGDVLAFARLRDGPATYRLSETDMGATLRSIVATYGPEWEARGARVETAIDGDLGPVAHDPQSIAQLVLNLVDNAIKYGGPDCRVDIRLCADEDRTCLEVTDHGCGIDAARLQRIWHTVQRGGVVAEAEGSGLGLSLAKQIADAHGAHFVLDGASGHSGLRALVSFPCYEARP